MEAIIVSHNCSCWSYNRRPQVQLWKALVWNLFFFFWWELSWMQHHNHDLFIPVERTKTYSPFCCHITIYLIIPLLSDSSNYWSGQVLIYINFKFQTYWAWGFTLILYDLQYLPQVMRLNFANYYWKNYIDTQSYQYY